MPTKPGHSFITWFSWNEIAIAAGFLFPSWMLVNAIISGWDPVWQFFAVVIGGAIQGFLTGFVQWALFARTAVVPPLIPWLAMMTGGTAIAWVVAQVPGFLPAETDASLRIPLVAAGIAVALGIPLIAQWWVLRIPAKGASQAAWKYSLIAYVGWLIGAAIMGGVLVILAEVTDIKVTVVLLVVGALVAVMCASAGTWLGATVMSGQTRGRPSRTSRSPRMTQSTKPSPKSKPKTKTKTEAKIQTKIPPKKT
ncbi:unannotated protein [freshwater metagenome]|uniref:Unannotated protein n=1 Tax=freshwater metagenome TaxID=449393 RepID=A0A6J6EGN3_9ZZZZ|nr:hypothetical protein [Actinomycetota bacterium]